MINRLFINYPYFVKQNPVKINSADPVDTIMSMGRYEMEKLFMSVVRKDSYAWASRNGDPKYEADRRIRDVEKHLNNHFKNERDLMDTLVYFVEEGAIVPTKKSMTSKNKSNGGGITMSRRFTIRASKSFDPDREQLDLSEEGAYIIRELENEYGVKMPERGWSQVMDYIEDMVRNPSIYRSSGPAHDFRTMSMHLESVIYDIYEELTGVTVV